MFCEPCGREVANESIVAKKFATTGSLIGCHARVEASVAGELRRVLGRCRNEPWMRPSPATNDGFGSLKADDVPIVQQVNRVLQGDQSAARSADDRQSSP